MTDEPRTVREYAQQSERHARRMLEAQRRALYHARVSREQTERYAARLLENINDAKRVMLENGWTE